ncbi:Uncharacterized protein QTN25_000623 [Entamoeba marina]
MVKLEKIYLANIVLYFNHYSTAQLFTLVNKKCKDALEILHINPCYYVVGEESELTPNKYFESQQSFIKEISLFPLLETVQFNKHQFTPQMMHFIPKHIRRVIIKTKTLLGPLLIDDDDKSRIVEMNLNCNQPIDLSEFPNLNKVYINPNGFDEDEDCSLGKFFTNKNQRFEHVTIKLGSNPDVEFLTNISQYNFKKIVLRFDCRCELNAVARNIPHITEYVTFACENYTNIINDYDVTFLMKSNGRFEVVQDEYFPCEVLEQYYPHAINFMGSNNYIIDLEHYTMVDALDSRPQTTVNPPTSLTYFSGSSLPTKLLSLKELSLTNYDNSLTLPKSTTKLSLDNCNINEFNFELNQIQNLKFRGVVPPQITNFNALTYLEIRNTTVKSSLSQFRMLKKLLIRCSVIETDINSFYPSSLDSLVIDSNYLPDNLNLTDLLVRSPAPCKPQPHSLMINRLELSKFSSILYLQVEDLTSNNVTFPTSVEHLCLFKCDSNNTEINLFGLTSLKSLTMSSCENISLIIPVHLKQLTIQNCVNIIFPNIKDVHLQKLALVNVPWFDLSLVTKELIQLYYDTNGDEDDDDEDDDDNDNEDDNNDDGDDNGNNNDDGNSDGTDHDDNGDDNGGCHKKCPKQNFSNPQEKMRFISKDIFTQFPLIDGVC